MVLLDQINGKSVWIDFLFVFTGLRNEYEISKDRLGWGDA